MGSWKYMPNTVYPVCFNGMELREGGIEFSTFFSRNEYQLFPAVLGYAALFITFKPSHNLVCFFLALD